MQNSFEEKELGECLELVIDHRGKTPKKLGADWVESGIPTISAKNVNGGRLVANESIRHVSFDVYKKWMREDVKRGDCFLVSEGATLGECMLWDYDYPVVLGQRIFCLRANPDILYPRYLYAYMTSNEFQAEIIGRATGTSVDGLRQTEVLKLNIVLPPMSEQQQIGDTIYYLNKKIELNRRMTETLEALAQSLFKSWFVDAAQSVLPKGWRESKLGEVLSVIETGGRPKGGVSGITEGVPSVGAESIVGIGRFDYGKTKFVPRAFFDAMNKGHVKSSDVLLYKDGGRPGEFEPHVTMVGDGFPFSEFSINEHVYRLRAEPNLPQSFLFFWMSSDSAMEEMRRRGTGVAIPGLNSTQVRELAVLCPPAGLLRKFDEAVSPLIRRIFANCNESRTLAALRDALLPKLLSGELRVPVATKLVDAT